MSGPLHFNALLVTRDFNAGVESIKKELRELSGFATKETRSIDSDFKALAAGVGSYFTAQTLIGFTREIINIRGEFQKTEIAFGTMLGSQEKAQALMSQMVDLAAKTPFSLQQVSAGAKQLLAFQVPAEEVVDTLTRMGNIAAGLGVPLERINLVYGQVKAKGRLMGDDLRQFTEAGIPMVAELAKKFNTSTSAITEMVTAGKIGFKDVQDVLFSLTNEGGMFYNLMEKQSKSLSGQVSNLGDSWDQMLNKIGQSNEGLLSDGIQGLNYLVEHYQDVINVIATLVATYGAYRAALMAANALQQAAIFTEGAVAAIRFAQSISGMTKAQLLFNMAAEANPYVLLASGIATLVGAVVWYKTQADEAKTVTESMNAAMEASVASVSKESLELRKLYSVAVNDNKTRAQRLDAIQTLQKLYPSYFGNMSSEAIMAGNAAGAYRELSSAIIASAKARAIGSEAEKIESERLQKLQVAEDKYNKAAETYAKKRREGYKDKAGVSGSGSGLGLQGWRTISAADQKRQDQENVFLANKELQQINKTYDEKQKFYQKHADRLNKQAEKYNKDRESNSQKEEDVTTKSASKAEKAAKKHTEAVEKIYGEDTIKGLQQRIFKLNEVLETSAVGSEKYNNAKAQKSIYEERLKSLTQSFDDEIAEMERQWKVRYALAEKYGEETAKAQFPELKGESYYADVKGRFSTIDNKLQNGATLTDEEISQWQKLKTILDGLNGVKDPFTNYKDDLEKTLSGIESGAERIKILEKDLYTMSDADIANGKKSYLIEKIDAEKEAQKKFYTDFLKEKETFEQKKNAIDEKYNSLDAQINGSDKSAEEKSRLLAESGKARGTEYSAAFIDGIASSEMWQKAFGEIGEMTNSEIRKNIKFLQDQLKKLAEGGDADPTKIKSITDQIKSLQSVLNENPFEKIKSDFKKMMDVINDPSSSIEQKLGSIQSVFNDLGAGVQMVGDAFGGFDEQTQGTVNSIVEIGNAALELGASIASGNVAGMIKAGIQLIGSIAKALNGDQKKERHIKAWAKEVEKLKIQYDELNDSVKRALGEDQYKNQQKLVENLRMQVQKIQLQMDEERRKKKADQGKINDYQQQINGINNQVKDLYADMAKAITQTDALSAASKLADALTDAWVQAGGAAVDYGNVAKKVAEDVMKDAVKKALEVQFLQKPMAQWVKNLQHAMGFDDNGNGSFDGLTDQERADLISQMQNMTGNFSTALQAYNQLFSNSTAAAAQDTLKGDIQSMTEKTGSALEGQINAIRIVQVEGINIMRDAFAAANRSLANIERNTYMIYESTEKNYKELVALNTKIKSDYNRGTGL